MFERKPSFFQIFWCCTAIIIFTGQCKTDEKDIYQKLRNHADQIRVIDTHEHQSWPSTDTKHSYNLYHLLGYLGADMVRSGAPALFPNADSLSLDALWNMYGEALDYSRNTSFYYSLVQGFRKLYEFKDQYFTKDNIPELSAKIGQKYSQYDSWFDSAFHKAGFELMLVMLADKDDFSMSSTDELDKRYFAMVFVINRFMEMVSWRPENGVFNLRKLSYEMLGLEDFRVENLDDYLILCDRLLRRNLEGQAVAVKNTIAYHRTLEFEDVSYETAYTLFNLDPADRSPEENKKLEDFMFHWTIRKCIKYDLPIQIHTGPGIGDSGNPMKLNNLFRKYPQAKFILLHGGFPWTGECALLGKMHGNVYLDLVWLPQLSREEAMNAFEVMLDCVPYNRFFWGGDCVFIEESAGALELGKEVVAGVLAGRIKKGLLTEEVAIDILNRIFRENAIEVYKLEERLGREF